MKKMISNIVFTKNRPLQLDAYLEGLYRYFPAELIQTYIIYKIERFEEEYEQLFQQYSNCIVIKEKDFHSDFLKILGQINTKYILFGVDDVVYFDSIGFEVIDETFNRFSKDIFGFSLRFDVENLKNGNDPVNQTAVAGQTIYSINWTQGRTLTTRYPFELCATIYLTVTVKNIINNIMNNNILAKRLFSPDSILIRALSKAVSARSILKSFGYFFSPNTLESWTCRWCQNHSDRLPNFLFFQKQCSTAIQVNMVNTSILCNEFYEYSEYAIEVLANKYKQGYRFDINNLTRNKPTDTHCGPEYFKLVRNNALCATKTERN